MAGKIIGDIAIGFTQLVFWMAFAAWRCHRQPAMWIGSARFHVAPDMVWTLVITLVPSL